METIKFNPSPDLENHFSYNDLDVVKIKRLKTYAVIGICEDELVEPKLGQRVELVEDRVLVGCRVGRVDRPLVGRAQPASRADLHRIEIRT